MPPEAVLRKINAGHGRVMKRTTLAKHSGSGHSRYCMEKFASARGAASPISGSRSGHPRTQRLVKQAQCSNVVICKS